MEQKQVTFKVAKVIKEAGGIFPANEYYALFKDESNKGSWQTETICCPSLGIIGECYAAPTYLDVWLWLWREKKIQIDVEFISSNLVGNFVLGQRVFTNGCYQIDPEDAIIAAIDYLVDNDLIK